MRRIKRKVKHKMFRVKNRINDTLICMMSPPEKQRWVKVKKRLELRRRLNEMEKEFRKQLYSFITGALAFVAALFWRDALEEMAREFIPYLDVWHFKLLMAVVVSLVAILGIFVIGRVLKAWAYSHNNGY